MSIQRAIAGLFGLGNACESDAGNASESAGHSEPRRSGSVDVPLYGEAAAIRTLYQVAFLDQDHSEIPRHRRAGPSHFARLFGPLKPPLRTPLTAKA